MSETLNTHMEECPNCLGAKSIWNGEDFVICTVCHGTGEVKVVNTDEEEDTGPEFVDFDELEIDPDEFYDEESYP